MSIQFMSALKVTKIPWVHMLILNWAIPVAYIWTEVWGQSITQQYLKVFNNDKSKLHVSA